jgi:hypothetical protein
VEFPVIQALALGARIECLRVIADPSRDARDLLSIWLKFRAGLGTEGSPPKARRTIKIPEAYLISGG